MHAHNRHQREHKDSNEERNIELSLHKEFDVIVNLRSLQIHFDSMLDVFISFANMSRVNRMLEGSEETIIERFYDAPLKMPKP